MGPHIPVDAHSWARTANDLIAMGIEWPEGLCIVDLRFLEHEVETGRVKRMPSYRKLMKRWNKSDHKTRLITKSDWRLPASGGA